MSLTPTHAPPTRWPAPRIAALILAGLVALLTTGCLEQLSSTRIPEGAARNFYYYLVHNEQADANTYWAPDYVPADAAAQVARGVAALRGYTITLGKSDVEPDADGALIVTLNGHIVAPAGPPGGTDGPVMRARLIERGPGWRLTEFSLPCCPAP